MNFPFGCRINTGWGVNSKGFTEAVGEREEGCFVSYGVRGCPEVSDV